MYVASACSTSFGVQIVSKKNRRSHHLDHLESMDFVIWNPFSSLRSIGTELSDSGGKSRWNDHPLIGSNDSWQGLFLQIPLLNHFQCQVSENPPKMEADQAPLKHHHTTFRLVLKQNIPSIVLVSLYSHYPRSKKDDCVIISILAPKHV